MTSVDEHGTPTPATPAAPPSPCPRIRRAATRLPGPAGIRAAGEPPQAAAGPPPNAGATAGHGRSAAGRRGLRLRPARVSARRSPARVRWPPADRRRPAETRRAARLRRPRAGGLARPATRARRTAPSGPHPAAPQPPGARRPAHGARSPARPNGVPRTKRAVVDERSRAAAQRHARPAPARPLPRADPGGTAARRGRVGPTPAASPPSAPRCSRRCCRRSSPVRATSPLRRFRTGAAIMAAFVLGLLTLLVLTLRADRSDLLGTLLSSRTLVGGAIGLLVAALAWMAVIVRTYLLARPTGLRTGQRAARRRRRRRAVPHRRRPARVRRRARQLPAPAARTAVPVAGRRHPRRGGDRQGAAERPAGRQRRRAGPARHAHGHDDGRERRHPHRPHDPVRAAPQPPARAVPGRARRWPAKFPKGFHNPSDPLSGDYLLNAVYAYAHSYPRGRARRTRPPTPGSTCCTRRSRRCSGSSSTTTSR